METMDPDGDGDGWRRRHGETHYRKRGRYNNRTANRIRGRSFPEGGRSESLDRDRDEISDISPEIDQQMI